MKHIFTWVPAYQAIVNHITTMQNNQLQLIADLRSSGVDVRDDQDNQGNKIPLTEIDPFTFLCHLNIYGDSRKKNILIALCRLWNIDCLVEDVHGIPSVSGQKIWLFPYSFERTHDEINRLWNFFQKLLNSTVSDIDFQDILQIKGVGKSKITEVMFMVNPDRFLCLNGKVTPYLLKNGLINTNYNTWQELIELYNQIRNIFNDIPFYKISYDGFLNETFSSKEPNYYRIGSTEGTDGKDILPEMLFNDIVSIGWSDIGDLDLLESNDRPSINKKMLEMGYYVKDGVQSKSTVSKKAGEIFRFYKEIEPYDFVLVNKGEEVRAIAKIYGSNYVFVDGLDFPHGRVVEWIDKNVKGLRIDEGNQTSVSKLGYDYSIQAIKNYLSKKIGQPDNEKKNIMNKTMDNSLNTIFFGPPGTGKTYTTISESIKVANRNFVFPISPDTEEGRKLIKTEFERLQKLHRVTLTTFHQSLSYEDFIEGIKPALNNIDSQHIVDQENITLLQSDKNPSLEYVLKAGIFKNCCAVASYLCHKKGIEFSQNKTSYTFDQLYDAFINDIIIKIKDKKNPVFETLKGKIVEVKNVNKNRSIIARAKESIAIDSAPLTKANIQKLYDHFKSAEEITSLQQVEDAVQVTPRITEFYAVFRGLKEFEKEFSQHSDPNEETLNAEAFNLEDIVKNFETGVYNDAVLKHGNTAESVVLIVDEINRGNIASIFGELITLIETDKRWGAEERLMLKLPYSQSDFFVPVNLYLIGTMNTADRSVEAIDTALRRRFEFKPILPNANALKNTDDGIELSKLLTTLNDRLAILKDKDHLIGHAWFWNVKNIKDLQNVFANKIIPLLQEYFYNDYEKLGLLIGKAFFEAPLKVNTGTFATFYNGGNLKNQYQNRMIYSLKNPLAISKEEFIALYQSNPVVAEEDDE